MTTIRDLCDEATFAGAALLDRTAPGWADEIDLDDLDLESPWSCVAGQLAPRFESRLYWGCVCAVHLADKGEVLPYPSGESPFDESPFAGYAAAHGFLLPRGVADTGRAWGILTASWRDRIVERRSASA